MNVTPYRSCGTGIILNILKRPGKSLVKSMEYLIWMSKKHGFAIPIVKTECEHKLPLKYGDEFEVEISFINSEAAKIIFQYKIVSSGNLICTGKTTQVFTDNNSELVLNNPSFFLDWKKKMGLIK